MTHRNGFTIVELLVVIVVIGILATITIVAYSNIQLRARDTVRSSDIGSIQKAIGLYYVDNGFYPLIGSPNSGNDIQALATALGVYSPAIPDDPRKGGPGITNYQYVNSVGGGAYGIRISYEAKPQCKVLVNTTAAWWGTATPVC